MKQGMMGRVQQMKESDRVLSVMESKELLHYT